MVYSNKFAVCVKVGNQIAREIRDSGDDVVRLPFGTDFGLMFKNLNSTRAVVSVSIDGKDVLDGNKIVIGPNSYGDLSGFLKGSSVRNKFRFIKKTDKIAENRGDFIDDGIIRVSWQFEKPRPVIEKIVKITEHHDHHHYHDHDHWYRPTPWWDKGIIYGSGTSCGGNSVDDNSSCIRGMGTPTQASCNYDCDSVSLNEPATKSLGRNYNAEVKTSGMPILKDCLRSVKADSYNDSDKGITVAGADTYQGFDTTYVGELEEQEHVIVIQLKGESKEGKSYETPKLVRSNVRCPTCGTSNSSRNKFCSECGTNISDVTR